MYSNIRVYLEASVFSGENIYIQSDTYIFYIVSVGMNNCSQPFQSSPCKHSGYIINMQTARGIKCFVIITSSNWNIFRVTGPLCGEFIGHRWIPRTKASVAELWYFLLVSAWLIGWVNNCEAGDLGRHRAHSDAIVMVEYDIDDTLIFQVYLTFIIAIEPVKNLNIYGNV